MLRRALRCSVLLLVVGRGCGGAFACLDDDDCSGGACEPSGWCSFPDSECPSGSRYGSHAGGGFAGECVGPIDTTGSEGDTSATPSTTADTSSPSSTTVMTTMSSTSDPSDPTTPADSSDTGPPAQCGDGIVEGAETCDDGNATPGDGCSETCQLSGSTMWQVDLAEGLGGAAHSIERFANGDVAVGHAVLSGSTVTVMVSRVSSGGEVVWQQPLAGLEWIYAAAWGLAIASEDEQIAVAVAGTTADSDAVGAVGAFDSRGGPLWVQALPDTTCLGAAYDDDRRLHIVGHNLEGVGREVEFESGGGLPMIRDGDPFAPPNGFAYDIAIVLGARYIVGQRTGMQGNDGFIGAIGGMEWTSFDVGLEDEALALAIDIGNTRAVVGGATNGAGGWVAGVDLTMSIIEPFVITSGFPASVHGIAVDPSGAIIAVGWDTVGATRDHFIAKLDPSFEKVWNYVREDDLGDDDLRDVVIMDDGSIFVVGQAGGDFAGSQAWVARVVP